MSRNGWLASLWLRAGLLFPARSCPGKAVGTDHGKTGDGQTPGARSRSPVACRRTSRTTRPCASAMKPSIKRCSFKVEAHDALDSAAVPAAHGVPWPRGSGEEWARTRGLWRRGGRDATTRTIVTLPGQPRRSLTSDQGGEKAQHGRLKIDASEIGPFEEILAQQSVSVLVDAYNFAGRLKSLKASPRTSSSAKHGLQSPTDSNSIRLPGLNT
jgi:hypothetical protein